MSIKDKFTEEEWQDVMQAPMLAGIAVTAADPGGLWSAVKESSGLARSLLESKASADADSLPSVISASFEDAEGRRVTQEKLKSLLVGKKPAEVSETAVARLQAISQLVEAKAPEHAGTYKDFLKTTAQKVAEAGTEGGFLGFGGEKVSDAEKKTLADIERALA